VHVLYQNALYALPTPARKGSLSTAVAEALLGYYGEQSATVASELALLFEAGRDFARASDSFVVAAQNAARVYANQEAVALLGRALANAEKLQGEARPARVLAIAFHRARLYETLSRFQEAIADFGLAEKVASETNNVDAQISALCGMGRPLLHLRRQPEAQKHGSRALELARGVHSSVGVASAELILACARTYVGDLVAAEQYLERGIPVLKEKGLPAHAQEGISYRILIHAWRLEYGDVDRALGWAVEKVPETVDLLQIIERLFFHGLALGNQGRISEALSALREGMRIAELNGERHFLSCLPNTMGWLHRELQDLEAALRLDTEGAQLARETGMLEGEANSHINLGHDHLALGEVGRALEHLQEAERLCSQNLKFNWRYHIRLQAELACYWIARSDLKAAASHAAASLQGAAATLSRKHLAWAHKLLGDIAALEERVEDGQRSYATALGVLQRHPCPTIEWKILKAAADLARRQKDDSARAEFLDRSRAVVQSLADALQDDKLRQRFLAAKPVRDLSS
jgi:tetratricopeptide (TPR) repeat protein